MCARVHGGLADLEVAQAKSVPAEVNPRPVEIRMMPVLVSRRQRPWWRGR